MCPEKTNENIETGENKDISPPEPELTPPSIVEEQEEGMPEGPGFMALYTTLMLLLMTFFIVLVSMGKPSQGEFEKGMKSISSNFSVMGLGGSKEALLFMHSVLKIKSLMVKNALDNVLEGEMRMKEGPSAQSEDTAGFDSAFNKEEVGQMQKFVSLGFNIAAADVNNKFIRLKFPDENVFEDGSAEFKSIFMSTLRSFLMTVGKEYSKIIVRVYSVSKPNEDTGLKTALELSALRASKIANAIEEIHGVEEDKIQAIGMGEYYAGVENTPKDKRELVEMEIYDMWKKDETAGELDEVGNQKV